MELLLMNNRVYAAEIAQGLSSKKRVAIVKRAKELNVRLTNGQGKVKKNSAEWEAQNHSQKQRLQASCYLLLFDTLE